MRARINVVLDGVTYYGKITESDEQTCKQVEDTYKTSLQDCAYLSLALEKGSTLIISGDKARQAVIIVEKLGE